mgnify:CR=1 FL=1
MGAVAVGAVWVSIGITMVGNGVGRRVGGGSGASVAVVAGVGDSLVAGAVVGSGTP